jgi:uncharacterized tellurite resistance protein B-like protein
MTKDTKLGALDRGERLQLLRFVTSFAWADLTISAGERAFVHGLVTRLHLAPEEAIEVEGWLKVPPPPDAVDPTLVPREHRQLFLATVKEMVKADGEISSEESENLALLEQLMR